MYTIQKRKTYGYFEKGELMRYKIILAAAVFIVALLLRELKNMEADDDMKHIMGNSPKCYECKYYVEEEDVRTKQAIGYCTCKQHLRLGINGRVVPNPPERIKIRRNHCCKFWEDAESGYTHFEVMTGYKEPYDGTRIEEWR